MAKYEATSPLTLIAGETVATGLRGRTCVISTVAATIGQALQSTGQTVPVVGVFAQDSMIAGEPVTVNQLIGKMQMVAVASVTAGQVIMAAAGASPDQGKVNGVATLSAVGGDVQIMGVALEGAAVDAIFQVLVVSVGTGQN